MLIQRHFRIRSLGQVSLVSVAGDIVTAVSVRPRHLAVLAVLTLSASRPVARDVLVEMFWGGETETRARHSLSNALSGLRSLPRTRRRSLRGSDFISLNPEARLEADVLQFVAACEMRDDSTAAGLYAGPFLEGVYVSDSPQFDLWLTREARASRAPVPRALRAARAHAAPHRRVVRRRKAVRARDRRVSSVHDCVHRAPQSVRRTRHACRTHECAQGIRSHARIAPRTSRRPRRRAGRRVCGFAQRATRDERTCAHGLRRCAARPSTRRRAANPTARQRAIVPLSPQPSISRGDSEATDCATSRRSRSRSRSAIGLVTVVWSRDDRPPQPPKQDIRS